MKATSAYISVSPRIANSYLALASSHHSSSFIAACSGCRLAAESVFQEAMRTWEWFVKEVLIELMCGYSTGHAVAATTLVGAPFPSKQLARSELLRVKYTASQGVKLQKNPAKFLLLHNPNAVIAIARRWLVNSPIEQVYLNYKVDIDNLLKLRHGLAHGTQHAHIEARATMTALDPLNTYSSIGEFLLAKPKITSPSWLDTLIADLYNFACEVSP